MAPSLHPIIGGSTSITNIPNLTITTTFPHQTIPSPTYSPLFPPCNPIAPVEPLILLLQGPIPHPLHSQTLSSTSWCLTMPTDLPRLKVVFQTTFLATLKMHCDGY